jgi:hypothetical protein
MGSSTCCAPDVRAGCCRTTSHHGRRSTANSGHGSVRAHGKRCIAHCGNSCGSGWDENRTPRPSSSIANRSRRPKKGASRVRCGEESQRQEEAYPHGHARAPPQGEGSSRRYSDRDGARLLLKAAKDQCPRVLLLFADGGYQGALVPWIKEMVGWLTEIVRKPSWKRGVWLPPGVELPVLPRGFQVLPLRWVVERSFAWIGR